MLDLRNAPANDRLIVALDVERREDALSFVDRLGDSVSFYKIGYELFIAEGMPLVREVVARGKRIFLDLKIDDVEETVTRAVRRVADVDGIQFLTIYGGRATAQSAVAAAAGSGLHILQVTLLTSLGAADLEGIGLVGPSGRFATIEDYVEWRGRESIRHGCHGLIASGQNARLLRDALGPGPLIVCPGIRPVTGGADEHKRPSAPYDAVANGASFLVVGRPIRNAADPQEQARAIIGDIARGLRGRA